ncbi:MAG: sigma-70 family RNA polymerase sigma factor [Elusimicrobiota bacterium]|jgi:RNA polymerase sigma-70 factor (ECF subfamily)
MSPTDAPQDFSSLYDRYFSRVYGYVRCRVASAAEADDVAARVFEKVLEALPGYRAERGSFEAWLFAVARNAVRDHYRARRWRSFFSLDDALERPSGEPRVEDRLEDDEDRRRLVEALEGLDERTRDVLALRFQAGLTNRDIAATLGLGESHVAVLIHRAVKRLQSELEKDA